MPNASFIFKSKLELGMGHVGIAKLEKENFNEKKKPQKSGLKKIFLNNCFLRKF